MAIDTHQLVRPARLTVAIGLFDSALTIRSAVRDLANHGFGGDRVFLVSRPAASGGGVSSNSEDFSAIDGVRRIAAQGGRDAVSQLHELVRQTASGQGGRTGSIPLHGDFGAHYPGLGLERQAATLMQHLTGGDAVLIVRTESADEERAACSMLLHYAGRGVQTHQVRYATSTPQRGIPALTP